MSLVENRRISMKKYLANAFSLSMTVGNALIEKRSVDFDEFLIVSKDAESIVGHAETAAILSQMLGREVNVNRVSVRLDEGDIVCVAQYIGPRLPEGATSLPEGAQIEWMIVRIVQN